MTELFVVTGTSRGLGLALALELLRRPVTLLAMARTRASELDAVDGPGVCEQWAVDLSAPAPIAARLEQWLNECNPATFTRATLINNAGLLGRVGPITETTADDLAAVLRVGLEAPLLLTQVFLRETRGWPMPRRVLQISSGAGRSAYAGWLGYCAAKAGLDHATRVLALDQARDSHPARVVSLAPGVIDTAMQEQLRTSDPSDFPDLPRFLDLHQKGQLATPADAARRVMAYLDRADFGTTPVADVRQAG